jgi:hypothetical protein
VSARRRLWQFVRWRAYEIIWYEYTIGLSGEGGEVWGMRVRGDEKNEGVRRVRKVGGKRGSALHTRNSSSCEKAMRFSIRVRWHVTVCEVASGGV